MQLAVVYLFRTTSCRYDLYVTASCLHCLQLTPYNTIIIYLPFIQHYSCFYSAAATKATNLLTAAIHIHDLIFNILAVTSSSTIRHYS